MEEKTVFNAVFSIDLSITEKEGGDHTIRTTTYFNKKDDPRKFVASNEVFCSFLANAIIAEAKATKGNPKTILSDIRAHIVTIEKNSY